MARRSRGTQLAGLVCHSDAGSQFTSVRYGERLAMTDTRTPPPVAPETPLAAKAPTMVAWLQGFARRHPLVTAFVVVFIFGGIVNAVAGDDPAAEPQTPPAVEAPEPEPEPAPEPAPEPEVVAPEPEPVEEDDTAVYATAIVDLSTRMGNRMTALSEASFAAADGDPDAWVAFHEISAQHLRQTRSDRQELEDLTSPAGLDETHRLLLAAYEDFQNALELSTAATRDYPPDADDVADLELAAELIGEGNEQLSQATAAMP